MKTLLKLALLLCIPAYGQTLIHYSPGSFGGGSGGSTSAIDMTGGTFCAVFVSYATGASFAVTSLPANTWTPLNAYTNISSGAVAQMFYAATPAVNSTMTASVTGTGVYGTGGLACWSGFTGAAPDQQNGANANTGTLQPGAVVPAANGELILTMASGSLTSSAPTVNSPYTLIGSAVGVTDLSYGVGVGAYVQPTAGSTNPTWTISSSDGAAAIASFTNVSLAATPVISPTAGRYGVQQSVSMTAATSGSTIYYTTDGSTPTTGSTVYTVPFNTVSSGMETVKAIAVASGYTNSAVAVANYTIGGISWYVDPVNGGTRYSSYNPTGQCNGLAATPYVSGVNQNCPFNDFRLMWTDPWASGGDIHWLMSGGDTLVVANCTSGSPCFAAGSTNSSAPGDFGYGVGHQITPPDFPSGVAGHPTIIEGANFANCSITSSAPAYGIGPVGIPWTAPDPAKVSYLYSDTGAGGYHMFSVIASQYVTFSCLDLAGNHGTTAYGIEAGDNSPANGDINFLNVNIHGFQSRGIIGSIGGLWNMTNTEIAFNAQADWDFDRGDHPVSTGYVTASYLGIDWAGCTEEAWPATDTIPVGNGSCLDDQSSPIGYGDGIGTPNTITNFTFDHSRFMFNTQDGPDLGHTYSANCTITNSIFFGNMGGNLKCGPEINTIYINNLVAANCGRMDSPIPGTGAGYNSKLSDFCRAADQNSFNALVGTTLTATMYHNTFVGYGNTTVMDGNCASSPGVTVPPINCTWNVSFKDNLVLDYTQFSNTPTMWNQIVPNVEDYNLGFNLSHDPWTGAHSLYTNPLLTAQPASPITAESQLDNFNFALTSGSPAKQAGVAIGGQTTDAIGNLWLPSPSMGALEGGGCTPLSITLGGNVIFAGGVQMAGGAPCSP